MIVLCKDNKVMMSEGVRYGHFTQYMRAVVMEPRFVEPAEPAYWIFRGRKGEKQELPETCETVESD